MTYSFGAPMLDAGARGALQGRQDAGEISDQATDQEGRGWEERGLEENRDHRSV